SRVWANVIDAGDNAAIAIERASVELLIISSPIFDMHPECRAKQREESRPPNPGVQKKRFRP
ncbi:MAG: hypothetical protein WBD96_04715, partial [Pseudolabrys sp.]